MIINAHDRIILEISNDLLHAWLSLSRVVSKLIESQYAEDDPFLVQMTRMKDEASLASTQFDIEYSAVIREQRSVLYPIKKKEQSP